MQRTTFTVSLDRSRRDAFVLASQAFLTSTAVPLFGRVLPPVVVLRLGFADGREAFVGCLSQHAHQGATHKLLVPFDLARDLEMQDGALIEGDVVAHVPRASKVLVAPLTVDESEVVEQNALRLEGELLRQVQVVYPSMTITVSVFAGVQARVRVERIECGEAGVVLTHGAAMMFDGTHFIVATRARAQADASAQPEAGSAAPPTWSILRALPAQAGATNDRGGVDGDEAHTVRVHSTTAARLHWPLRGDALALDAVDLAALADWTEAKITPAFLREHTRTLRLQVADDGVLPDCCVVTPSVRQATNLLLLPRVSAEVALQAGGVGQDAETRSTPESATGAVPPPTSRLAVAELRAVHGAVVDDLLDHLRLGFADAAIGAAAPNGNVLLSGAKGYGKTTVLATVLRELSEVHTVWLECTSGKSFLPALQRAVRECVLAAPAVLVLDNFDVVAPAQAEGAVAAMTDATCATLEAVLRTFPTLRGFAAASGKARVMVVATCASRESVSEALRGATCFARSFAIEALTPVTRTALLGQLFPDTAAKTVRQMAAMMDNYTPFDVIHVAARIRGEDDEASAAPTAAPMECNGCADDEALVRRTERATARFTPLAHTGIKFLKGDKLAWGDIGGLAEAKKALYDTLVLPMKHRELFARLPLKTRSGILLYGPSGCGKTFILEALVNAEQLNCIVVNGPEVFGKYIGQSEQKIRDVFERAQAAAPCVVFFDEFDSVAPQRGIDNSGVTDRVVNQLLCYLDGVEGRKDVYVVAASSRPDLIDAALLRPGRLDKAVQCPVPSLADREAILRSLLARTATRCAVAEADIHDTATKTPNWTPADLAAMVSTANTLVSQRVLDEIARQQAHDSGPGADAGVAGPIDAAQDEAGGEFVIAGIAKGTTRDKVVDALRRLAQDASRHGSARARVTSALQSAALTRDDLAAAMATTRPSLSQRDLDRQARIHALFSHGHVPVTAKPGTKLTFS